MKTFLVLGDYSGNNTGHNALLYSIIAELRALTPCKVIVPTMQPAVLEKHLPERDYIKIISIAPLSISIKFIGRSMIRAVREADCILLTDNLFYDSYMLNPFKNPSISLVFVIWYARRLSKPVVYYNAGVGPVNGRVSAHIVRFLSAQIDVISLRDNASVVLLEESTGISKYFLTSDSGLNIMKAFNVLLPQEPAHQVQKNILGVNLSYHLMSWLKGKGIDMNNFTMWLSREFSNLPYKLRFFVTHKEDRELPLQVTAKENVFRQASIEESWNVTLNITIRNLKQVACFIGSRYHELVFCAGLGIPIIGIDIDEKIHSLFEELELPDGTLDHNDILNNETSGLIAGKIQNAINEKDVFCNKVAELNERKAGIESLILDKCCSN